MVQSLLDQLNGIPDQLMFDDYSKVYQSKVEVGSRREGQDRYVEMCHSRRSFSVCRWSVREAGEIEWLSDTSRDETWSTHAPSWQCLRDGAV